MEVEINIYELSSRIVPTLIYRTKTRTKGHFASCASQVCLDGRNSGGINFENGINTIEVLYRLIPDRRGTIYKLNYKKAFASFTRKPGSIIGHTLRYFNCFKRLNIFGGLSAMFTHGLVKVTSLVFCYHSHISKASDNEAGHIAFLNRIKYLGAIKSFDVPKSLGQ